MAPDSHSSPAATDYSRPTALLAFLEADLDRGLRLTPQAKLEWESDSKVDAGSSRDDRVDPSVAPELLRRLEAINAEISRSIDRARARHIQTGQLGIRAYQFGIALAEVCRLAAGGERP